MSPVYNRKIDSKQLEADNVSDILKNASKCFPNLQRIQIQDIKITEENKEDLIETANFFIESLSE